MAPAASKSMPNLDKAYLINFTSFVPLIRSADYCVSVHAPSSIHTFFPRSSLHISIPIHHPFSVSASSNSKSNLLVVRTYLRQLIQISVMGQIVTKESPTEFLPPVQTRGMANLESNLAQQNILTDARGTSGTIQMAPIKILHERCSE